MKIGLCVCGLLVLPMLALTACGDDDGGEGGGCANAQMVCASDDTVEIDCEDWDSAPASVRECAGNATTCEAVQDCLFQ